MEGKQHLQVTRQEVCELLRVFGDLIVEINCGCVLQEPVLRLHSCHNFRVAVTHTHSHNARKRLFIAGLPQKYEVVDLSKLHYKILSFPRKLCDCKCIYLHFDGLGLQIFTDRLMRGSFLSTAITAIGGRDTYVGSSRFWYP